MVHVRSAGVSRDLPFAAGMTANEAIAEAGIRLGWLASRNTSIQVGSAVVGGGTALKDEDTVTVAPKIKNG